MKYLNTDTFGNTIYIDEETKEMYSFAPEEIEGKLLEDYPWNEAHIITEFYS